MGCPSLPQRRYLLALVDPKVPARIGALARAAGVHRATVHRWHQKLEFREWLDRELRAITREDVQNAWQSVLERALEGRVPAAKLFLARFDPHWPGRRRAEEAPEPLDDGRMTLDEAVHCLIQNGYLVRQRREGDALGPAPSTDRCPLCQGQACEGNSSP